MINAFQHEAYQYDAFQMEEDSVIHDGGIAVPSARRKRKKPFLYPDEDIRETYARIPAPAFVAIDKMSPAEIDAEISLLMKKKMLDNEDDEKMCILLALVAMDG